MDFGAWLIVVVAVAAFVAVLAASLRHPRRVLWCPEREALAEVETDGDAYVTDPVDRSVRFCSLWDAGQSLPCNRECVRRFSAG